MLPMGLSVRRHLPGPWGGRGACYALREHRSHERASKGNRQTPARMPRLSSMAQAGMTALTLSCRRTSRRCCCHYRDLHVEAHFVCLKCWHVVPYELLKSHRCSHQTARGVRRAPTLSFPGAKSSWQVAQASRGWGPPSVPWPVPMALPSGEMIGDPDLSSRVMRALHDDPPLPLFYFYRCYRAMLRVRLSIAHLFAPNPRTPEKWRPQALAYLRIVAADARRLENAVRRRADRKGVYPHAGGVSSPREGAHKKGLAPCSASGRASRGTAERYRW